MVLSKLLGEYIPPYPPPFSGAGGVSPTCLYELRIIQISSGQKHDIVHQVNDERTVHFKQHRL